MKQAYESLLNDYHDWLKSRFAVADVRGVCEITTPFLDRHNDRLQIYVEQQGDGFRLSDDSYVISDLEASGCPLNTEHRRKMLSCITRGFSVDVEDQELVVYATEKDFPRKKHLLIQAMLSVNDMFMTSKRNAASFFHEDVAAFLASHDIRFTPDVEFTGKSGFLHRFDCVIPASKEQPERLIKAINNPTQNDVTALLFAWTDTRAVRPPKSTAYAVLNDEERRPSKDIEHSLGKYGINLIPWRKREDYVQVLKM